MNRFLLLLLSLALMTIATASAASFFDVQANNPQIAGDASSNTTATFPTNKQNEPTIAVNPTDNGHLIAGANDEQEQPPCGPGPVRGFTAPANDCSFFPGVGTSGVYVSSNGGASWTNKGLLDGQAAWQASPFIVRWRSRDRVRPEAERQRRLLVCERRARVLCLTRVVQRWAKPVPTE